jgi:hypothetical protein
MNNKVKRSKVHTNHIKRKDLRANIFINDKVQERNNV